MIFFGHIGIVAFVAALFFLPALFAGIGGIFPDVFDKILFLLGVTPCTRFFGHTILFAFLAGLVTFIVTRKKSYALAMMLGSFLHLIQDLQGDVPFLYPFVNYAFFSTCGKINIAYHLNIIELTAEVIGVIFLIVLIKYRDKFEIFRRKFWLNIGVKNEKYRKFAKIIRG